MNVKKEKGSFRFSLSVRLLLLALVLTAAHLPDGFAQWDGTPGPEAPAPSAIGSRAESPAANAEPFYPEDKILWARQELPYSVETVSQAVKDLSVLADRLWATLLFLPRASVGIVSRLASRQAFGPTAGALLLLACAVFLMAVVRRRIRTHLGRALEGRAERELTASNRLAMALLRVAGAEMGYWLCSALIAAALLLLVELQAALKHVSGGGVRGLDELSTAFAAGWVYVLVGSYMFLMRLLTEAVSLQRGRERLLRLPGRAARHLERSLKVILTIAVVMLVPISVLSSFDYNPAFVMLLWAMLRGLMFFAVLWLATRRGLLDGLLKEPKTVIGQVTARLARLLYPLGVLLVLFLLVLRSAGYAALSVSITLVSLEIVLGVFVLWVFCRWLTAWVRERSIMGMAADEPEMKSKARLFALLAEMVRAAGLLLALYFAARVLGAHYGSAVLSPYAPAPVRGAAVRMSGTLRGAGAWFVDPLYGASTMTPLSIMLGAVIVLVALLSAGRARRLLNQAVVARTKLERSAAHTLSRVAIYLLVGIAVLIGLNVSGVPLAALGIFAGATGLAVGFGMQAILSNFFSGIIIMIERHIRVGDCIKVGEDLIGYIESINARSTTIATFDNYRVIVPNKAFIENEVINWTTQDPKLRIKVDVGIAYGSDTELARESLLEVARQNALVLREPEPQVFFLGFGDSSLSFRLLAWVKDVTDYYKAISALHFEIDRKFRERDIVIAFPQQDIHLRSVDADIAGTIRSGKAQSTQPPLGGPAPGRGSPSEQPPDAPQ